MRGVDTGVNRDPSTDDVEDAWVEVRRSEGWADAEQQALVLTAVGIGCQLVTQGDAILVLVPPAQAARARDELASYASENRPRPRYLPGRALGDGLDGSLAYAVILLFLHGASRRHTFGLDWWSAGAGQAGLFADGEWWRAVTALGLHADLGHLAGNLAFGGLLGLLLAQPLGVGLAWLAILLAGGAGNAVNAVLHPAAHTGVGASTAVFAALGLLAALNLRRQASVWGRGVRRWLPLGASAMLLAYMGMAGERTDVGAHIAGLVAGALFGLGLALVGDRIPQGRGAQHAYGALALALLALAWLLALRTHG
jgi:rhomboid protease GluP